ncbi:hypothetical protein [Nocardia cyriacigeorgica]|uniref:hypothetical protein n=1 Tax=Nocardia cyriacigeorgica TaxID=135487 RepID=UPI001893B317|nr:hypothetical protein [Nocardia cyriacigeorgica]MBF6417003.1 hypothetical protein [Nocardia cyriacigeorgica]
MAVEYLGLRLFAHRVGIEPGTLKNYKLPPADAIIKAEGRDTRGWLPKTVDDWNARRPGKGRPADAKWNIPPEYR